MGWAVPPLVFCVCKGRVKLIDLRSGRSSRGVKEKRDLSEWKEIWRKWELDYTIHERLIRGFLTCERFVV